MLKLSQSRRLSDVPIFRSESMWEKLGMNGLAVQAPWPIADEEDKILTRQAAFLRKCLKKFRSQVGKAKKLNEVSIILADSYPRWKVDILLWMQGQYHEVTQSFPDSFMKDLKAWTNENVSDKKMIKDAMQFASFMKGEVAEVGTVALDVQLPFDQASVLESSMEYIKSQLDVKEIDIRKVEIDSGLPDKVKDQPTPGNPYMWLR
jgi:leucyl-tRNA synthetase